MTRPLGLLPTALTALALLGSGCSGNESRVRETEGRVLFHEIGCADCHSFAAAGARARVGSDLDAARPSYAEVRRRIERGGAGMPSFAGRVTDDQAETLATFVSAAADATRVATAARFEPDETHVADCGARFACLEQAFGNLAYRDGPRRALAELDRLRRTNSGVEADCHRIAHTLGAATLARYGGRVGEAFARGSPLCASGYYHGITERAFSDASPDDMARVARTLCSPAPIRATSFLAYQCVHGLGHGLMIATDYDLRGSLRTCDALATAWDRTSCSGGVFMENITSSYGVRSRWLRDDDPLYPCTIVAERHKLYCYLIVTSRILPLVGHDFARAAAICRRSEPGWVRTCFESLGRDASGQAHGGARKILALCANARDSAGDCLYGAVRDVVNTDAATPRAVALCARAPRRFRFRCFHGIGTIVGGLYAIDAARARACARVSDDARLRSACRLGVGLSP